MKVAIEAAYTAGTTNVIDLPEGVKWGDLKDWYVKWDTLNYTLDGEKWSQIEINSNGLDAIDWKRPTNVTVYGVDDEGDVDYGEELGEK